MRLDVDALDASEFAARTGSLRRNSRRRRKVLLIEDDFSMETIFDSILHDVDPQIEVDWVTSAEDAFNKLEESKGKTKNPYDLIVADIFLDGKITGVDLWNLCQSVYPSMPVLVMSGLPLSKLSDFMGPGNMSPLFLQKPLNFSECFETIRVLLNEQG